MFEATCRMCGTLYRTQNRKIYNNSTCWKCRDLLRADRTRLRKLTVPQWMERINTLAPVMRRAVYSLVWWDYLSDLHEPTPAIYKHKLSRSELVAGLIAVGYTEAQAKRRLAI